MKGEINMSDGFHRILSGSPERRAELIAAGCFVVVWFVMDAVQWVDWLITKIAPAAVVCIK